ncbi:MAG: hypothetical protein HYY49_10135 [Ignavibacteriales bacterium]|nr:hypothetical protein [Ignavibacteriales bacterium]
MTDPSDESLDQIADKTAALIVQAAANSAFVLFRDKKFRQRASFSEISEVEQDRIFNELSVAFLTLIMLTHDAPDLRTPDEFRGFLANLKKRIPKAHIELLRSSGVEHKYLRIWEKLIQMRYEEYSRDKHDVRKASMEIESSEKGLDLEGLSKIQMLVPIYAVAIGCHHHICRGKTHGRDELFKQVLKALSGFYVNLRVHLEGGRITPLTRARMALKRLRRRFY